MKKISCIFLVYLLSSTVLSSYIAIGREVNTETGVGGADSYNSGYRYNINGWIYLHIEGKPYDRGYQHGYLLADEIVDMIYRWSTVVHTFSVFKKLAVKSNSSRYDDISRIWWDFCKTRTMKMFWNSYPEEYKKEIEGVADGVKARGGMIYGAVVTREDILALNEMYEFILSLTSPLKRVHPLKSFFHTLRERFPSFSPKDEETFIEEVKMLKPPDHCSAFIATGDATVDGRIVASQSNFYAGTSKTSWFSNLITQRWNVIIDVKPAKGYRIIMTSFPGSIWSDEDFYQNENGIILMETSLNQGPWTTKGVSVVVRARKAIQYGSSIDQVIYFLTKDNNGLMPNQWLIGDAKTGEIASLELTLFNHPVERTFNGVYYGYNLPRNPRVSLELTGLKGYIFNLLPTNIQLKLSKGHGVLRKAKFEELNELFYGKIDVEVGKQIMSTSPINIKSADCKITDSRLIKKLGLWVFMGTPGVRRYISPSEDEGLTDTPSCGWVQLFPVSPFVYYHRHSSRIYEEKQNGRIIWEYESNYGEFGNEIYSSPAFYNDTLFFSSWNGEVYTVDSNNGRRIWYKKIGWNSISSPCVIDDIVFVGSSDGLYALNAKDGDVVWKNDMIGCVVSKPSVSPDVVYCGSLDGKIYGLNKQNGKILWSYTTNDKIYSSPYVMGNIVFIGSNDGKLYALNKNTGEKIWSFQTEGSVVSSPIVYKDTVFFGSWDGKLYALSVDNGEIKWSLATGWGVVSTPIVLDETVYFGSLDNNFYAVDIENGEIKWFFTAEAAIQSSPLIYGGLIFFGCDDGRVYVLNASTGKLIWTAQSSYAIDGVYNYVTTPFVSSPIAYNGKVFIGSIDGKLYAFDAQTVETPFKPFKVIESYEALFFLLSSLLSVVLLTIIYLIGARRRI